MSLTQWIDGRIKIAVAAALTPENLKTISDAVVAAVATQINAEGDRIVNSIIGHVTDSAATVISEVSSHVDSTAQSITNDVNSVGAEITADTTQIIQGVVNSIKKLLPFPL